MARYGKCQVTPTEWCTWAPLELSLRLGQTLESRTEKCLSRKLNKTATYQRNSKNNNYAWLRHRSRLLSLRHWACFEHHWALNQHHWHLWASLSIFGHCFCTSMHEYALSTSVESAARWFAMTLLKSQKWSEGSCSPKGWTGLVGTDLAPNVVIHVSAHTEFGVWALNSIQGTKSREFRRTKSASQWKSQVAISGEQDCYSQHLSEHQIMNETNTTVPDAQEGIPPFWYFDTSHPQVQHA